ncbi:MAG: UDP-N-acetylglucosamine--N-acetylmuramyl-(pentapeptide) pyrophosphoryl-undecaprenol N-acetylglucosamine transferase [Minisyncoccia bacterium]
MKIVLTGGGTGGHFYPLIAVAEEIFALALERHMIEPQLFYIGPEPFDKLALQEHNIVFIQSPAGKLRRYASILNVFDFVKTFFGIIKSVFQLYSLYPDVIFSKGGYASFPTLVAARILAIPVIVHESDASVGRANLYGAKFARFVAISYPGTEELIPVPKEKIALVGHPVRKDIALPAKEGMYNFLELSPELPTILVMGGTLGAQTINNAVIDALPLLLPKYQVIHQTGAQNLDEVRKISQVVLKNNEFKDRYKTYGFLNTLALRMSAGAASLVVSRAGTGTIFEISAWGLPSIIIPIPEQISHDQTKNAFAFARVGACTVIEQHNLTSHILVSEINRIMETKQLKDDMVRSARTFARPDAARKLARVILDTVLEHEA